MKMPWPKKWEGCFSRIMAPLGTLCQIEIPSSQISFDEPCGSAWGRSSKWTLHSDPK
jgi:hypothetical protein